LVLGEVKHKKEAAMSYKRRNTDIPPNPDSEIHRSTDIEEPHINSFIGEEVVIFDHNGNPVHTLESRGWETDENGNVKQVSKKTLIVDPSGRILNADELGLPYSHISYTGAMIGPKDLIYCAMCREIKGKFTPMHRMHDAFITQDNNFLCDACFRKNRWRKPIAFISFGLISLTYF
jgi:hypothetical protein